MKYIKIPEPLQLGDKLFKLHNLMAEVCWPDPFWRQDGSKLKAMLELRAKFEKVENQVPGAIVAVQDQEHEWMTPLVTLQGKNADPRFGPIMMCMYEATSENPNPESSN